jgi:hypothetical protein
MCTSVVLDANVYSRIKVLRGDVYRLLAVDMNILMFGGVICRAGGNPQHVILVVLHGGIDALFARPWRE